jgi:hypothetical protein
VIRSPSKLPDDPVHIGDIVLRGGFFEFQEDLLHQRFKEAQRVGGNPVDKDLLWFAVIYRCPFKQDLRLLYPRLGRYDDLHVAFYPRLAGQDIALGDLILGQKTDRMLIRPDLWIGNLYAAPPAYPLSSAEAIDADAGPFSCIHEGCTGFNRN